MVITFDPAINSYKLIINDTWYGSYHSAVAAAGDVYSHATGCYEWDILDGDVDSPSNLYEWTELPG